MAKNIYFYSTDPKANGDECCVIARSLEEAIRIGACAWTEFYVREAQEDRSNIRKPNEPVSGYDAYYYKVTVTSTTSGACKVAVECMMRCYGNAPEFDWGVEEFVGPAWGSEYDYED